MSQCSIQELVPILGIIGEMEMCSLDVIILSQVDFIPMSRLHTQALIISTCSLIVEVSSGLALISI